MSKRELQELLQSNNPILPKLRSMDQTQQTQHSPGEGWQQLVEELQTDQQQQQQQQQLQPDTEQQQLNQEQPQQLQAEQHEPPQQQPEQQQQLHQHPPQQNAPGNLPQPGPPQPPQQNIHHPITPPQQNLPHPSIPPQPTVPPQPTPFPIPLPQPPLSFHTNSPPQSRIPLDSLPFKLSQFSGDPQENPSRFVKDFRLAATISSWPRELWSTAFQLCLKGAARTWFERLSHIILQDPDHIFAEFLRKYRPSGIDWAAESLFSNSIQAPYETVKQFANRTTELGGRAGKSERDILHQFIKGLSPPCTTHTLTQGPTTLEEAINKATLYESAMKFSQPSSLQHMTEGQGDRPKASQGHKRLWCSFCGKQGHLLKNCRVKKQKIKQHNQ